MGSTVINGEKYEWRSSLSRNTERCFHSFVGREAAKLGSERPALCRLGDVSPERIACRSQSDLCLANQRMVWADHSTLRRRWQNLASAGNACWSARPPRTSKELEQQIRLRFFRGDRQATDHASVVRRDAAPVGVQAGVAS